MLGIVLSIIGVINVGLLWNKLTLTPLKFLRKDLKKGKQAKALKLPDWSFLKRFRIRVILQNKVCYLILFVGIYLSGLLLMFGVGLGPLLEHYVDNIDETLLYEYQYILKAPVDNSDGEKLKMYTVSTYSERYQKDVEVSLMGIVHDDNVYCKYYEVVYILFHTGMRISEFCGLTIKDIDLEHRIVNIDHQLQRLSDMTLVIEPTKTSAGTRKLPITEDVAKCFQAIIEDREKPKVEKVVDGYTGFLFLDDKGLPLVAMHWEHRFNHMVKRYNDVYRVQMPNITPHICRHTYCSNMAKSGMNPKTLQYLMGHSDIGVTLNTYTHLGLEDAEDELKRLEDLQNARKELERTQGEKPVSQKMFKAI